MPETYTTAALAREFGLTTRAIRFYEQEGLIAPARRGRTRVFSPRDRVRLRLVQRGRRLGFSIREIREILDLYDGRGGGRGCFGVCVRGGRRMVYFFQVVLIQHRLHIYPNLTKKILSVIL